MADMRRRSVVALHGRRVAQQQVAHGHEETLDGKKLEGLVCFLAHIHCPCCARRRLTACFQQACDHLALWDAIEPHDGGMQPIVVHDSTLLEVSFIVNDAYDDGLVRPIKKLLDNLIQGLLRTCCWSSSATLRSCPSDSSPWLDCMKKPNRGLCWCLARVTPERDRLLGRSMCKSRVFTITRTSLQPCSPHFRFAWANTPWASTAECSGINAGMSDGISDAVNLVSLLFLGLGQHFCSIFCDDATPIKWDLKEEKVSDALT